MVQESMVEYINSQMKAGLSRDAIKTTLVGAGWQAADVEDTLKKVEMAKPAAAQPMSAMPAASPAVKPAGTVSSVSSAPQTIKVSDLVSSSASSAPMTMAAKPVASTPAARSPLTGPAASTASAAGAAAAGAKAPNTFQAQTFTAGKPHGSRGPLITEIVLAVIIVVVAVFAGFLYMQNGSLNSQLKTLSGNSSGVNSQLSALQAQVASSTATLTAQVSTLTSEAQELQTELSFYTVPAGAAPGATITASFSGTVSGGGKTSYVITAMYGGKIYVSNSKAASVIAAMAPLLGTSATTATSTSKTATSTASSTTASSTTTASASATSTAPVSAQFTGTYAPGSDSITLTSVNGTSL